VQEVAAIDIAAGARTPWVNRGAQKLAHAMTTWPLGVQGRRCLDVGASTGGFTQVLLSEGARQVVALDVGHGQLRPELAADPRVVNLEGRSIRGCRPADLGGTFDAIVADLSFISLGLVLPTLASLLAPATAAQAPWAVLLVKPQFEVGRERLGKNGIVTNPRARADALRTVIADAATAGLHLHGLERSPLTGSHGNVEYLLWVQSDPSARMDPEHVEARIVDHSMDDPEEAR
jgi:23S rRNA (cytidine1920-2'-O)/16S rRNA (cytidine1409-2'-O)-methyltransferase